MATQGDAIVPTGASGAAAPSHSQRSNEYQKIGPERYAPLKRREVSSEARYWKRFKFPVIFKEYAAVSHIEFSPVSPHDFAVTSSTRVQIYSPITKSVKKTISRFKDTAYGGTFRNDGKLLAAGEERGAVQIFDVNSRMILRKYTGHLRAVHALKFGHDGLDLFTGGDDKLLKCWDVAVGQEKFSIDAHDDYIRSVLTNPASSSMIVTGSYDHTVKLWDTRNQSVALTMDHGSPVEAALVLPTGGICISAGSYKIKVWDLIGGGRLLKEISNHQKTVTCLCTDANATRLLSGSLDQQVKIYNITDYRVAHSIKYTAPILSLGMSPDESQIAVGMSNGLLSLRHRVANVADAGGPFAGRAGTAGGGKGTPSAGTRRFFVRGKAEVAAKTDLAIDHQKKKKLAPYDVFMKKFQYRNALDAALEGKSKGKYGAPVVMGVVQELIRRDALKLALSGRDETSLEPMLSFVLKNITNARYVMTLIDVCSMVLDMYTSVLGVDMHIDDLFVRLQEKLNTEIRFQKRLMEIQGSLQLLVA